MPKPEAKLTHTAAIILQVIQSGAVYGYTIMDTTGLPSGTVYPALRRLERDGLIRSQWERLSEAEDQNRPQRKYYKLTPDGRSALLASHKRYPLLARLIPLSPGGKA
jgi:PadR family transcriptional regulator, regulatory protein PadR